ncbi:MAG: efflux transporter outer membrane subunit [Luteibacter sp.]|uniref:efflux transporter outer membrane subunit n=1 Tax=unclassified Luteibacter TaxID=2620188 RepID=UPI0028066F3E|nr:MULTISPECIES: efflux transporter outer membrane subunit [unclassified Luteibacter]MDQ7994413.1 efflux transporter outer membrane subunit [Luteibacter sp.]MDQ8048714.1 efflux transporter outer membrane subunit [Luteibacter sp.]MDR6642091.1 NodT family efflux transporter outer membrane factor (OMF) lipoprotein [Luteibacter sp. 1214]
MPRRDSTRQRTGLAMRAVMGANPVGEGSPTRSILAGLVVSLGLSACSLAPAYKTPDVPVAPQYANAESPWTEARPADHLDRDGWWKLYGDSRLNDLQTKLVANNASLAAALAHYEQSEAFTRQVRAGLFPQIGLNGNGTRNRESDTRPLRGATSPTYYNSYTIGAQLDYEIDLWGRVRDTVTAGTAEQAASAADLASARLSLQAQLADSYLQLNGFDRQIKVLNESIDAFAKALNLTQSRHEGGIASGLDVARAQTQLSSAKSQLTQAQAQRSLVLHAIAVLVGDSASSFQLATDDEQVKVPTIPVEVPSVILQRRPDIAAAERRTAAANARIGVARSAFYPQLTLDAQGGWQSSAWGSIATAPNRFWAIGPTLALNLFDGGRRKAVVAQAQAATDEAGARYRDVVLNAFAQVEDNLTLLRDLGSALNDQRAAADAAQRSVDLSLNRYREGAVGYLDVVQAQTTALDARRSVIDLETRQLRASVQLIRALGGGWSTT